MHGRARPDVATPPPAGDRQVCDLEVGEGYAAALAVEGAAPVRVTMLPRAYSAP